MVRTWPQRVDQSRAHWRWHMLPRPSPLAARSFGEFHNFERSWICQWASLANLLPFRESSWMLCDLVSLTLFQIPAYDPVAIMMMGFGVLLVAALAFVL